MYVKRIDFSTVQNLVCVNLGRCGFHAKAIARRVHLSETQVRTRLRKADVRLREYRDIESDVGRLFVARVEEAIQRRLADVKITMKPLMLQSTNHRK